MKILIAVSSKHGSTREIAASIADTLGEAGLAPELVDPQRVGSVAAYDAVIVGSAVYLGRWMGPARDLVNRSAAALRTRPVWLFSSGPLGRGIVDPADAAEGMKLLELVGARDHRVFPGKLDKEDLGFLERGIVSMVKNPYGDHRDWPAIREWAASIAAELADPATCPDRPALIHLEDRSHAGAETAAAASATAEAPTGASASISSRRSASPGSRSGAST